MRKPETPARETIAPSDLTFGLSTCKRCLWLKYWFKFELKKEFPLVKPLADAQEEHFRRAPMQAIHPSLKPGIVKQWGLIFLGFQAYEYIHAYSDLNLKLTSGIYGSTFFMLTGFHGFHVFLGGLMLTIVLRRMIRGDFTAENHFGFEGAAWYWHFVDVVWLGLYIVVYWM